MKKRRLIDFSFFRIVVKAARLFRLAENPGKTRLLRGLARLRRRGPHCLAEDKRHENPFHLEHFLIDPEPRVPSLPLSFRRLVATLVLLSVSTGALGVNDADWCETTSPDFQLISDLPESEQLELIRTLERFEQLVKPYLPGESLSRRGTLKLIVFQYRKDFLALTGKRLFAGYMQPSLQTNRLLIGPIRGDLQETTLHEYAHYLLRNRSGMSLPMWFDEGLATLLGNTELGETSALIGEMDSSRMALRLSRGVGILSPQQRLRRTLEATSVENWHRSQINEFYDLSWLLTHYLYFSVYQEDLERGTIQTSGLTQFLKARDQSLPEHLEVRTSRLIRVLEKYIDRWDAPQSVPIPTPDEPDVGFRCLDPFERDLSLAQAVYMQNPALARKLLSPYVGAESDPVSADRRIALNIAMTRVEIAADKPDNAEQWLQQAQALDARHAETTVLTADLLVRSCLFDRTEECGENWRTANTLYRRAIRQDPTRYDGIFGVGLAELHLGRAGDAANYLKVAHARAPWAAVINYYLGESYRLMGDSRAGNYLQNARNWAVQDIWRLLAEESLRLIAAADQPGTSQR